MVGRIVLPSRSFRWPLSFCFIISLFSAEPQIPAADETEEPYFQTHFQDECQFIIETISTDLAEMFYFAKNHSLPLQRIVAEAEEVTDAGLENLSYRLVVKFPGKETSIRSEVSIDQPIWDPRVYDPLINALADKFGIKKRNPVETNRPSSSLNSTKLADALLELNGANIEIFNQQISEALSRNFLDRDLHEQAALLLGAFGLREASGHFSDTRLALCRMTAHLAFARGLDRASPVGIVGRLADALLYTLMNNQRDVLQRCDDLAKSDPRLAPWIRALRTLATGDYRPLRQIANLSHLERIAFSSAGATLNGPNLHFRDLSSWEFQSGLDAISLFTEHHY